MKLPPWRRWLIRVCLFLGVQVRLPSILVIPIFRLHSSEGEFGYYEEWDALMADLQTLHGARTIEFCSGPVAVIPAGHYSMRNVTWTSWRSRKKGVEA